MSIETIAELHGVDKRIAELETELAQRRLYRDQLLADLGVVLGKDEELEVTVKAIASGSPTPGVN